MDQRKLRFGRFEAVTTDIQHLHEAGYMQLGDWNLAQICDHLTRFMRMSLEGFPFQFPWIVRRVLGPLVLKPLVLWTHWIPTGAKAPPVLMPHRTPQEQPAVQTMTEMLHRARNHPGEFHPSPLFGRLSNPQWRKVHLIHASHHLGFLVPNEVDAARQEPSQASFTDD